MTPRQEFEDTLAAYAMLRAETSYYRDVYCDMKGLSREKIIQPDPELPAKLDAKERAINLLTSLEIPDNCADIDDLKCKITELSGELKNRRSRLYDAVDQCRSPTIDYPRNEEIGRLETRIALIRQIISQLTAAKAVRERRRQVSEKKAYELQRILDYLT